MLGVGEGRSEGVALSISGGTWRVNYCEAEPL